MFVSNQKARKMKKISTVSFAFVAPPSRSSAASPTSQSAASPALPSFVGRENRCMVSAPSSPYGVVAREEGCPGSEVSGNLQ